jgi:hypothetical protein
MNNGCLGFHKTASPMPDKFIAAQQKNKNQ